MFVPTPMVRKDFAAVSTKIYEKPTRTGFRLAGPRDNPTTGVLDEYRYSALRLARNHQRHPAYSLMTVFRWLSGPVALNTNQLLPAVVGAQGRPLSTVHLL